MSRLARFCFLAMVLVCPSVQAVEVVTLSVQPSKTGSGIGAETLARNYHYIAQPKLAAQRKNVLVVFLGGSNSSPDAYTDVANEAAALGFGAVDLRYPNNQLVGTVCANNDACFTNVRGESIYGQGVIYPGTTAGYSSLATNVTLQNSVVNRLVNLLHYLRTQPADPQRNPLPSYWSQFLVAKTGSPYVAGGTAVVPEWSKIVIAGHSQGAGHSAFLGATLPAAIRRVVMFSAPNDHLGGNSASWIYRRAATPTARFWGMRSADEGIYGDFIALNWQNLQVGGSGPAAVEISVGTGKGATSNSQRLVLAQASSDGLTNHNSTVANGQYDAIYPTLAQDRKAAWRYLLSGNSAD